MSATYQREKLLSVCASMDQLAYIRPITFTEGDSAGLRGLLVKNGCMSYTVLPDRCLDIAELSYRGLNLGFLAKGGLQGSGSSGSLGFMFTSGLENTCQPCEVDGVSYPMHGSIRFHKAAQIQYETMWEQDKYVLRIKGQVRQSNIFGENLILTRTITSVLGERNIYLDDTIENLGFTSQPVLILYHCNAGFPLLDVGSRVLAPSLAVTPYDAQAARGLQEWNIYRSAQPKRPEECFLHRLSSDNEGRSFMAVVNDRLALGLRVRFATKTLPHFIQWKTEACGDYALGMEPTNTSPYGRASLLKGAGAVHELPSLQQENFSLVFSVLDGKEAIEKAEMESKMV